MLFRSKWKAEDETNPDTGKPYDQLTLGKLLKEAHQVREANIITNCSICHR